MSKRVEENMQWSRLYDRDKEPSLEQIGRYIDSPLWQKLNAHLQSAYNTQPKLAYSSCSMQPGWNVKYRKRGRSLCTLYPMKGYFIALVVIGVREEAEAELALLSYSQYVQQLFRNTVASGASRWLMIRVTEPIICTDVMDLIRIRAQQT